MFHNNPNPIIFSELVFEDQSTADHLRYYAENRRHGHLLLHGDFGTGKSTTAMVIANERYPDDAETLDVDAYTGPELVEDMESNIERIERGWAIQRMSGVVHPVAIVDEVDQLTITQQYKLRAFMDRASRMNLGSFIFTTNHPHHVDKGLINRCDQIEVGPLSPETLESRCRFLLERESVELTDAQLLEILETTDGSWRDVKRTLEAVILAKEDRLAA